MRPDIHTARKTAEAVIASDAPPNEPEVAIIDGQTIEKPYGWVFFYQSERYLETGHPDDFLYGNAPILVERYTGRATVLGTAYPVSFYVASHIARNLPRVTLAYIRYAFGQR